MPDTKYDLGNTTFKVITIFCVWKPNQQKSAFQKNQVFRHPHFRLLLFYFLNLFPVDVVRAWVKGGTGSERRRLQGPIPDPSKLSPKQPHWGAQTALPPHTEGVGGISGKVKCLILSGNSACWKVPTPKKCWQVLIFLTFTFISINSCRASMLNTKISHSRLASRFFLSKSAKIRTKLDRF